MTTSDVQHRAIDSAADRSGFHPVTRALRSWISAYVAGYEVYFAGTRQLDRSARLHWVPVA